MSRSFYLFLLLLLIPSHWGYGENEGENLEVKNYFVKIEGLKNPETISVYLMDSEEVFALDKEGFLYFPFKNKAEKQLPFSYGKYTFEIIVSGQSEQYPIVIDPNTPTAGQAVISIKIKDGSKTLENVKKLREVKVRVKKEKISASREVLYGDQARLIPGSGGDILKAVANFPGVIPTGGFNSGLYIRGGDLRDVLYSFDDIYIGNPYHLGGVYSVFPSIVVDKLIFYPSSFPNKFGNSQGAVLDIRKKKEIEHGKISVGTEINFVQASAYISIPIKMPFGEGMNITLSGRRTYFEVYIAVLKEIDSPELSFITDFDLIPFFYDYNLIYDWSIGDHLIWFSAVGSQDKVTINTDKFPVEDEEGNTNEVNFALDTDELWDSQGLGYIFSPRDEVRYDLTLSHNKITDKFSLQSTQLERNIREYWRLVGNGELPLSRLFSLDFGFEHYYQTSPVEIRILPPEFRMQPVMNGNLSDAEQFEDLEIALANAELFEEVIDRNAFTVYSTAYLDWKWLNVGLGLRLGGQDVNNSLHWDPRLFLKFIPYEEVSLYANIGKYSQLPWIERVGKETGTPELKTPWSLHYVLGTEFVIVDNDFLQDYKFKIEGYYKDLRYQTLENLYYDEAYFSSYENNPRYIDSSLGRAYGVEILIRKRFSKNFFGWIGYTWGRSERLEFKNQEAQDIANRVLADTNNNGADYRSEELVWRLFDEDIEHSAKFVFSWRPVKWFITGITFILNSGRPYTPKIIVREDFIDTIVETNGMMTETNFVAANRLIVSDDPDRIKANRYPINYTISLRFEFTFPLNKKKNVDMSLYLDLQSFQFIWHENVTSYNYNYNIVRPTHPDFIASLGPGPYPRSERTEATAGIPILPLLGMTIKY